ncbi:MAG TPA: aspartyl protease family protein [Pyrinomonadaceae bacterium]|nr:aspartyl protease family protein [Pyrinomonadaceae bacterium]
MLSLYKINASRAVVAGVVSCLFAVSLCVAAPGWSGTQNDLKTRQRAERSLNDGDFEGAEKIYRAMLVKSAQDHQARLGLSFALLKQRRLQEAYDQAARVITADPLSARAHALLGSAVLASGDFRSSVEEFRTALSLKENEALAIAGLAMVDFYENRLDSSIKGLRRAVDIDSDEPDYVFNLGQATARSERYKEAADSYERFLIIAPRTDADRRSRIRGLIDFLRYLGKQSSLYELRSGNSTSIPFESVDGRPILKVKVNGGKELLRFVLDTGSGMSVISEETSKKLGIAAVARGGMARAVGGGGKFEIVYGFLNLLEVGEVKVERVPVYIRRFYDEKDPVDGYLGLAVISRFVALVDYGENMFTLRRESGGSKKEDSFVFGEGVFSLRRPDVRKETTATKTQPTDALEIPVRTTSSGFLSGEVVLEGVDRPLNFIIDTGASITVVSEKLVQQEDLAGYIQPTRMRVFGAAGISEDVKRISLPKVSLGTLVREQVSAAVLDMETLNETTGFTQSGILGGNFLRHYRLSLDFQRGLVRLEPLAKTARKSGAGGVEDR